MAFLPWRTSYGSGVELGNGKVKLTNIGPNFVTEDQLPQYTVPLNVWFGVFPTKDFNISPDGVVTKAAPRNSETHYSLVGCTCAPVFLFKDFELAKRSELIKHFPDSQPLITRLLPHLPDDIVHKIFRLIPIKLAMRSTIVSKQWASLWPLGLPLLDFDDEEED